ncbi:MAG: prolyl oligopeptidase family serine peptidase [bacterium]|nr:prolyl oligopeptidase family serine peptidase [bacterium]
MKTLKLLLGLMISVSIAAPMRAAGEEIAFQQGLAISGVVTRGRAAIREDLVLDRLASGSWKIPAVSDALSSDELGEHEWSTIEPNDDGVYTGRAMRGGYVFFRVESDEEQVMLLESAGHSMVYVNGEPRYGDPYQWGFCKTPVLLKRGENQFLFQCSRGRLTAKLIDPPAPAFINTGDATLPDWRVGESQNPLASILIENASTRTLDNLFIRAKVENGGQTLSQIPSLGPLEQRKAAFVLPARPDGEPGAYAVSLELIQDDDAGMRSLHQAEIRVQLRAQDESYRRTFRSDIDGSVQYYAVQPAHPVPGKPARSLFLSLHGASVEAINQANAYAPKRWGTLVAATNRRPYGFDWEDWGRLDALEVLQHAKDEFNPDPSRVYLTGHSMGGHGTWQLGATFPGRWAAIGPSAGWISFWSYADAKDFENPSPLEAMMRRSSSPSDTLGLIENYQYEAVYILHGGADDVVPPSEAREMFERLGAFHPEVLYHEQPGVGHWWDDSDEPGASCVDWRPMFDLFAQRRIPANEEIRDVTFVTMNPEVSSDCFWLRVEAQTSQLQPSRAAVSYNPHGRRFSGVTDNVERISFSLDSIAAGEPLSVTLDGTELASIAWPSGEGRLRLERKGDAWRVIKRADEGVKGPLRYGPFKNAFNHDMVFVYGTRGTEEENAWAYAKARYDAESFAYRGNGSIDVIADAGFDPDTYAGRGVILYGHAEMNSAWKTLLNDSPVQVHRGAVSIGDKRFEGEDKLALFLRPRRDDDCASVGVVAGTGMAGMRALDGLPYFVSGVGFPDCMVASASYLSEGYGGVLSAGFFGNDWSIEEGDFAFQQ